MMEFSVTDNMHGSIFVFLKRFVEHNYNYSTWINLLEEAGIEERNSFYQMNQVYPTRELVLLVTAASGLMRIPVSELWERFGEFLVPDLLMVFKRYLHPSWRTFDMLLHAGTHMHGGIRKDDDRVNPPMLSVSKVGHNLLIFDYHSKRRMAGLAIGIIRGVATYFEEGDRITITTPTARDAERVQIRVAFN